MALKLTKLELQIMEALVHAAVIDPPGRFAIDDIERSIVDSIMARVSS